MLILGRRFLAFCMNFRHFMLIICILMCFLCYFFEVESSFVLIHTLFVCLQAYYLAHHWQNPRSFLLSIVYNQTAPPRPFRRMNIFQKTCFLTLLYLDWSAELHSQKKRKVEKKPKTWSSSPKREDVKETLNQVSMKTLLNDRPSMVSNYYSLEDFNYF